MFIKRLLIGVMAAIAVACSALAGIEPFPAAFRTQEIATNGTTLHVRVGGSGPAILLLHGYGESGDMWAPLAARLAASHTVIVPDLRGMGWIATWVTNGAGAVPTREYQ